MTLRRLDDPAASGIVNMARDEALLGEVGRGDSPATLRLYEWSQPTVSLGYFQTADDYDALPPPAGGLPVVRRLTGGGAILHDRELTYSLTLPCGHSGITPRPTRLYEFVHDALIACLAARGVTADRGGHDDGSGAGRGPFFCFARRHRFDVLIGDDKLAGSAQRRTRDAVLQHGSIMIERRFDQQPTATLDPDRIDVGWLRGALTRSLGRILDTPIEPGEWSDQELALAAELESKYAGAEWTRRR